MADVLVRQRDAERRSSGSSREERTEMPKGSSSSSSKRNSSSHGKSKRGSASSSHGSSSLARVKRHASGFSRDGSAVSADGGSQHSSGKRRSSNKETGSSKNYGNNATRLNGSSSKKTTPPRTKSFDSTSSSNGLRRARKNVSQKEGESSDEEPCKARPQEAAEDPPTSSSHSKSKPYFPKQEARMKKPAQNSSINQQSISSFASSKADTKKPPPRKGSNLSAKSTEKEGKGPPRKPIRPDELDHPDASLTISDHNANGSILDTSKSSMRYSAHQMGGGSVPTPPSLLGGSVSQSSRLSGSSGSYGHLLGSSRSNSLHASASSHSHSQSVISEGSSCLSLTKDSDFDVDTRQKSTKRNSRSTSRGANDKQDDSDSDDNSNDEGLTEEQKAWKGIEKVLNDSCSIGSDDTKSLSERVQKAMGLPQNMAAMATGAKTGGKGWQVDPKAFDVLAQEKLDRSSTFRKELPRRKQATNTLRKDQDGKTTGGSNHNSKSKSLCGLLPQTKRAFDGESSVAGNSAMPDLMDSSFSSMQSTETMSTILANKKPGLIVENDYNEGPMKDFLRNVTTAIERKQVMGPVAGASFSDSSHTNSSNTGSLFDVFKWSEKVEGADILQDEDKKLATGQKRGVLRKNTNPRDRAGFATLNGSLNTSLNGSLIAKTALSAKIPTSSALGPREDAVEDHDASLPSLMSYGGPNDDASMPSLTSCKTNGTRGTNVHEGDCDDYDDGDNNSSMPSLSSMKDGASVYSRQTSSIGENSEKEYSDDEEDDDTNSDESDDEGSEIEIDDSAPDIDGSGPDIEIDDSAPDIDDSAPNSIDKSGSTGNDSYYEESGTEYEESMTDYNDSITELEDEELNDSYYEDVGGIGGSDSYSKGLLCGGSSIDGDSEEEEEDLLPKRRDYDGEISDDEEVGSTKEGLRRPSASMSTSQISNTSQSMSTSQRSHTESQAGSQGGEGFRKPVVAPNLPILGVTAPSAARLKGNVKLGGAGVARPSKQQEQVSQFEESPPKPPKRTTKPQQPKRQKSVEKKLPQKMMEKPKRQKSTEKKPPQKSREKPNQQKSTEKAPSHKPHDKLPRKPTKNSHHVPHQVPGEQQVGAAAQFIVASTNKKKNARNDKEEKVRKWREQFEEEQLLQQHQQEQQQMILQQQMLLQQQLMMNHGGVAFKSAGTDGEMVVDGAQMNNMMNNPHSGGARGAGPMCMPEVLGPSSHSDRGFSEHNDQKPGRKSRGSDLKKSKSLDQDYDFSFLDNPNLPEMTEVDADEVLKPMNPSQMEEEDVNKSSTPKSPSKGKKDKKVIPTSFASRFKNSVKKIKNNFGTNKSKGLSLIDTGLNERQFFPDQDDDDDDEYTTRGLLSG